MKIRTMARLTIALSLISWNSSVLASYPEYFGTGPNTSSIGNQSNLNTDDPSNAYYLPALSAWSQKLTLSASISTTSHSFEPITNIVTENSTNGQSGSDVVYGDADTDYENSNNAVVAIILPLREKEYGAASLLFTAPIGGLAETNSGHPTLPEYSMYRSRYRRTQMYFNYALPLDDHWAVSLGAHMGFQASARVNTQVSLGDDYGSSGNAKTKIDPSFGAIASVIYKTEDSQIGFTFQQEMKSNLEAVATGEISDPPLTLINIGLENMIYYDPHILRASFAKSWDEWELFTSLEYQMWENYKAPLIQIDNLGGSVRASDDYERLQLKNIWIPKVGVKWKATESLSLMTGMIYRQSPLDSDFSQSGNTIDTDSFILTSGLTYDFKLFNKDIQLGVSAQYHHLFEEEVQKTSGQENGQAGLKIGAPGYKIGGHVIMAMGGLKVSF